MKLSPYDCIENRSLTVLNSANTYLYRIPICVILCSKMNIRYFTFDDYLIKHQVKSSEHKQIYQSLWTNRNTLKRGALKTLFSTMFNLCYCCWWGRLFRRLSVVPPSAVRRRGVSRLSPSRRRARCPAVCDTPRHPTPWHLLWTLSEPTAVAELRSTPRNWHFRVLIIQLIHDSFTGNTRSMFIFCRQVLNWLAERY